MISAMTQLWGLVSGSGFLWKLIRNWKVLSDAFKAIEATMHNIRADDRRVPNEQEVPVLLQALSNILKTGVIDIPGVDEYDIAMKVDQINSNLSLSIKDSKSGKFFILPVITKE